MVIGVAEAQDEGEGGGGGGAEKTSEHQWNSNLYAINEVFFLSAMNK